jgi:rsbT co-antagonist protein RsbR
MEQVQVAVSRRAPFAYRTAFTRPDNGKQIYVALQSNATPTEAESVHVGIIQDITQEIEREQELLEKLHKIEEQAAAIKELSTPVMEIWEDVLVLPIVGVVDTRRSMEIMNRLLESIVTHQTRCVIVDITGVEIVDTKTADYLLKVVRAAKLLGTRAVLTGLSPAVAQTLVEIGADLTEVRTLRNLKEGLRDCLRFLRQGQGETQAG